MGLKMMDFIHLVFRNDLYRRIFLQTLSVLMICKNTNKKKVGGQHLVTI